MLSQCREPNDFFLFFFVIFFLVFLVFLIPNSNVIIPYLPNTSSKISVLFCMRVSQVRANSEKGILSWMSLRFSRARKGSQEPSRSSSPAPISKL